MLNTRFGWQLRCFDTEEHARAVGDLVATYVRSLSRYIDLTALDGILIALECAQPLLELDRGCDTKHRLKLKPSEGIVLGVAMTPAVIRDGKIKRHILFNAGALLRSKTRSANISGNLAALFPS